MDLDPLKKHLPKVLEYGTISGLAYSLLSPDTVSLVFGHALEDSVVKAGLAFMLAAWIHSGRVKREISLMAEGVKSSINAVAEALRADLDKQSVRMGKLESGLDKLNTRVLTLEKGG